MEGQVPWSSLGGTPGEGETFVISVSVFRANGSDVTFDTGGNFSKGNILDYITPTSGNTYGALIGEDAGGTENIGRMDYAFEIYYFSNQLPITLAEFGANVYQNGIELNWTTASEINNSHFEIERSNDGRSWTTIGQVNGAGTTTTAHYYSFTDNNPALGYNYYRLRQVDFDGGYEYSEIVSGVLRGSGSISMAPNPVKDVLFLSPGTEIRIFDQLGRMVFSTMVSGNSIDISNLPSGLYIADLRNGSEQRTEQLIKQ